MNSTVNESIPNPLQKQAGFAIPAALEAEIDELITHYPVKRSASLMLLHAIQEHFGWISQDAIEWTAKKSAESPYFVMVPDILKSVSFIEKDSKRFPNTGGWGYAQFHYDGASDTFQPFGNDAACGHACHTAVAAKDYIFTAYPKR